MELYFHHVGQDGAREDFPKTVYRQVSLAEVKAGVREPSQREVMLTRLAQIFPSGRFNCWGAPAGAESNIRQLAPGDVVLLIESAANPGNVPVLY